MQRSACLLRRTLIDGLAWIVHGLSMLLKVGGRLPKSGRQWGVTPTRALNNSGHVPTGQTSHGSRLALVCARLATLLDARSEL